MKNVTFLFFCFGSFNAFTQLNDFDFSRELLKGYQRLEVTHVNHSEMDSTLSLSTYYISKTGNIERYEYYNGGSLSFWSEYEYSKEGRLIYEEEHRPIYRFLEESQKDTGIFEPETYHAIIYDYLDNQLKTKTRVDAWQGSLTTNNITLFTYDHKGRIKEELIEDYSQGIVIHSETNSTTMSSFHNKDSLSVEKTTYTYQGDSIVTTMYDVKGMVEQISVIKLNNDNQPIKEIIFSALGKMYKSTTKHYDSHKRIKGWTIDYFDPTVFNYDYTLGDKFSIEYNAKGLPIKTILTHEGQIVSSEYFNYR